jgi:hypothetical protein
MALRWKKNSRPTGLAAIVCRNQGSTLRDGETRYATVAPLHRDERQWYWVAGWSTGVAHKNTCGDPAPDEASAKAEAMAYVKAELQRISRINNAPHTRTATTARCGETGDAGAVARRVI